jgi:hypothetical protein
MKEVIGFGINIHFIVWNLPFMSERWTLKICGEILTKINELCRHALENV